MNNTEAELKKEKKRAYDKAYREANKDRIKAYDKARRKAYYANNKEEVKAQLAKLKPKLSFFKQLDNIGFFDKYIYPSDPTQYILYFDDDNKYINHNAGNGGVLCTKRGIYHILFVDMSSKIYSKEDFNFD